MVMVKDTAYKRANRSRRMKGMKITQVTRPNISEISESGADHRLRARRAAEPMNTHKTTSREWRRRNDSSASRSAV